MLPGIPSGASPTASSGQREAAARLLEVLDALDRAHEEFQQEEEGEEAPGPLRP